MEMRKKQREAVKKMDLAPDEVKLRMDVQRAYESLRI